MKNLFHSFLRDCDGAALPLIGFGLLVLIGSMGMAVDMSRGYLVKSQLSSAVDASGLAAGAVVHSGDMQGDAQRFFNANFPPGYMDATIDGPHVVPKDNDTKLDITATATINTLFMQFFGIDTMTVSADAEVTREVKGMELVLVLDTTGSMDSYSGSEKKIDALKTAAADLISILYGNNETINDLWVGIVPFAQAVNIGTTHGAWTNTESFHWGQDSLGNPLSWAGCVDARETSGRDVTDDPPTVALFDKYYWPCDLRNQWYGNNSSGDTSTNPDTKKWGNCRLRSSTLYGARSGEPIGINLGPNKGCSQAVTPLTASKTTVLNALQTLYPSGNTHVNLGLVWGWRMLSPRWQGLWGGEMNTNNLPLAYDTPLMNKVVVLMTDGENTMTNSVRTAYWYLNDNRLGNDDGNENQAEAALNTRTSQVCTSLKQNGVLVYTIAFGTGANATVQNLMRNCATKEAYYFYSPTSADLSQAFHVIGDSLANLRLSK